MIWHLSRMLLVRCDARGRNVRDKIADKCSDMEVNIEHDRDKARNHGSLRDDGLEETGKYEKVEPRSGCTRAWSRRGSSAKSGGAVGGQVSWQISGKWVESVREP